MLKAWKTDNITFGDLIQVLKVSKCLRAASFVENLLTVKPKSEEDQKPENENLFSMYIKKTNCRLGTQFVGGIMASPWF